MIALANEETLAKLRDYARQRGVSPEEALDEIAAYELHRRLHQLARTERLRRDLAERPKG